MGDPLNQRDAVILSAARTPGGKFMSALGNLSAPEMGAIAVKAALENGYRRMRVMLPALFTVTRDLNTPRTLSFSGIIKARKKTIVQWGFEDLGLPAEKLGLPGSPTIVTEMRAVENTRRVEFIEGTREEKAEQLVEKLVEVGVL